MLLTFATVFFIRISAQTPDKFALEKIEAKAGEKATGFVEVPKGSDEETQIAVSIFRGAKAGKVMLVFAGVHGSEYAPVVALQRLAAQINAKDLSGTLFWFTSPTRRRFSGGRFITSSAFTCKTKSNCCRV